VSASDAASKSSSSQTTSVKIIIPKAKAKSGESLDVIDLTDDVTPDRYLLEDAGFASCDALLVPYRGVRYHLREWRQGRTRYAGH